MGHPWPRAPVSKSLLIPDIPLARIDPAMKLLPQTLLAALFLGSGCAMIGERVPTERTQAPNLFLGRLGGVTAIGWAAEDEALWIATRKSGLEKWVQGRPPVKLGPRGRSFTALGIEGSNLILADSTQGRIMRFDRNGTPGAVLAATFRGTPLGDARDLAVHSSGAVFLLDAKGALLHLSTDGRLEAVPIPASATCLLVSGHQLFLGLTKQSGIWALELNADGQPRGAPWRCFALESSPAAMGVDHEGALLLGLGNHVQRYTRAGETRQRWDLGAPVTAIAVGGAKGRMAFLATDNDLFRVHLPSSYGQ